MITGKSLAKNFTIQTLGKFLAIFVGLGSIALVTRSLGVERFGEYTTALTFLQFFGVIVDFGLSLTLIVMISEPNVDEKKIVGNFFRTPACFRFPVVWSRSAHHPCLPVVTHR